MRESIIQAIGEQKIIAIVRGVEPDKCVALAKALYAGGIGLMEFTFNQKDPDSFGDTAAAIGCVHDELGEKVQVGAGTVLTPEQVHIAAEAGAGYIISPDSQRAVIEKTRAMGLVSIPGAMTPTEATTAWEYGADFVKLFPLGELGPGYMKALFSPLNHIRYLGVGGINADNIPALMKAGCLGFGIGGNLVNRQWIQEGQYHKITEAAKAICRAVGRMV